MKHSAVHFSSIPLHIVCLSLFWHFRNSTMRFLSTGIFFIRFFMVILSRLVGIW